MKRKLLVVVLDGADIGLLKNWSAQGLLPNLKKIMDQNNLIELGNYPIYRNEAPWESMLTGCFPEQTGYWTAIQFISETYKMKFGGAYPYEQFRPFYALAEKSSCTVFDLPHTGRLFPGLSGIQVLGWGAHYPLCKGISDPPELYRELTDKFGEHDAMKIQNKGSWWDSDFLYLIRSKLFEGIQKSGELHRYLLKTYPADLTILSFSEIHTAGHHFWHLTDKNHPLYGKNTQVIPDFLKEMYIRTDRELGYLIDSVSDSTDILILSPMGGASNWYATNSKVFLPELLFRWNFPGKKLFSDTDKYGDHSPVIPDQNHWVKAVWEDYYRNLPPGWIPRFLHPLFRRMAAVRRIQYPFYGARLLGQLQWQPAAWYSPWWHKMKAFSIPGQGDGYIRINLKGREKRGIVNPRDMNRICDELTGKLIELRNPLTG
ncbi:MAG: alkaline phosphatase family protein, partial [Bacteroidales bacterium]|nr:alkaline phosphatase family protein [Bacteroidales bacterium]